MARGGCSTVCADKSEATCAFVDSERALDARCGWWFGAEIVEAAARSACKRDKDDRAKCRLTHDSTDAADDHRPVLRVERDEFYFQMRLGWTEQKTGTRRLPFFVTQEDHDDGTSVAQTLV